MAESKEVTFTLRVFHAGDGDCLLLSAGQDEKKHILIDGGRSGAFSRHAARFLYDNTDVVETLDLVVVSHIDNDHISGVLRLLRDKVQHRVWTATKKIPGGPKKGPKSPPEITRIWHNSVSDQLGSDLDSGTVGREIANTAALLGGPIVDQLDGNVHNVAAQLENLATGHRSAIELEERVKGRLGIETEPKTLLAPNKTKSRRRRPVKPTHEVGDIDINVIGPTKERIDQLSKDWKKWIAKNADIRANLIEDLKKDEAAMGAFASSSLAPSQLATSARSSGISVPNLASLMLLVRCGNKRVLLTGDGSAEDILDGLDRVGVYDRHFDVLKVQHHGAAINMTEEFCEQVTADHYLFCGNGAHSNPELEVLHMIKDSRLNLADSSVATDRPFTFWFTTSPDSAGLSDLQRGHMKLVHDEMAAVAEQEPRFTCKFLKARGKAVKNNSFFELDLSHVLEAPTES